MCIRDRVEVTEVMNGIDSITGLTESTPAKWIGYIAKGYIPVSYTHLDVYKRQYLYRSLKIIIIA